MKIVIDIPKKLYDRYKEKDHIKRCDIDEFEKALDNCIILPKGMKAIDADKLIAEMEKRHAEGDEITVGYVKKMPNVFDTIIAESKESSLQERARLSFMESCYLEQGITQC